MPRPRPLRALAAALALCSTALVGTGAATAATSTATTLPAPKAAIVVDADSGKVLLGNNIHLALHPASTAKIFTALLGVERFAPDAKINACPFTQNIESESLYMPASASWPLSEMLASMMMVSANDAAYSIACTDGGLAKFATDANALAKRLGAQDTTLNDPAGLDDSTSYQGGPLTSVYDLAIATRNALQVPAIARWASTVNYSFTEDKTYALKNHNRMLPGQGYGYDGLTGFKTGHTDRAQHCLVATATRNGRTLIAVVLGAQDPGGYASAKNLLDTGFGMSPDTPGIGVTLPPTNFVPYATRAGERDAFDALAGNDTATQTPAATVVPASIGPLDVAPVAPPVVIRATHHTSQSGLPWRYVVIAVVIVGGIVFMLRRRAVRRRHLVRMAIRRQRMAAMRSGGLPVVDGRYRPGTRVGPPVESHVRVHPFEEERVRVTKA